MAMGSEIFIAGSGALNGAKAMELTANNLANVNTIGFKKDILSFSSFFYPWETRSSVPQGTNSPILYGAKTDFSQGMIKETGNSFDFALEGDGFFVVQTPSGIRYTRNGSFRPGSKGELLTQEGYQVQGENGPAKVDGDKVGTLGVREFRDLSGLEKVGNSLYRPIGEGNPAQVAKRTTVHQGKLELSNVNVVMEMTGMIETMRAYESKLKAVQTLDEVSKKTVNEIGRM